MANMEQLAGLISDVYSQIYEQRAAASLSTIYYKLKDPGYLDELTKVAEKQLGRLSISDKLKGIERTDENYKKIGMAARAKMESLSGIDKKRSTLAKSLSLSYMAMTQSAQMYGEALDGGYDRRTAGAAALMSAAGQFALMYDNPLGTWFLDEKVGYTDVKGGGIRALKKFISEEMPGIEKATKAAVSNKEVGKKLMGTSFKNIKDKMTNYISLANTGGPISNIKRNAIIEGIEEVSEQLVMDSVKGVTDFLSHMGLTGKKGTYGGFDVVFSKEGLSNYIMNFLGGTVGGAMFEIERSIITPAITGVSPHTQSSMISFVSNGQTKELLETSKEYIYNNYNTELGAVSKDINGQAVYGPKETLSQADIIYAGVEAYVNNINDILNSENVADTDEGWIRKAIVDEVKIQDMKTNNTDTFVISDINEIVNEIVTLKTRINAAEKEGKTVPEDEARLGELTKQIEDIKNGEKAEDYYGLSLFALNRDLHSAFISLNIYDYVRDIHDKNFDSLSKEEQDKLTAEFKMVTSNDGNFKVKMKKMYEVFQKYNQEFSLSLEEYGKDGYDALRRDVLKFMLTNQSTLNDAVRNKDLDTLKSI
jgi:hypothetical protein